MKRFRWALCRLPALILLVFMVAGCNTAEGFGKDLEGAGKQIQRWAK